MKYSIGLKQRYRYIRSYNLIKKPNENTNEISKAVQKLINKYVLKKKEEES
jgi:hypothetical protein